jgi:hypothetical protein
VEEALRARVWRSPQRRARRYTLYCGKKHNDSDRGFRRIPKKVTVSMFGRALPIVARGHGRGSYSSLDTVVGEGFPVFSPLPLHVHNAHWFV